MKKVELINYLDSYLEIKEINEESKNGLQVDTTKNEIKKIGFAVDATSYIFDNAIKDDVDLLIVHHGLFWGFESPITGVFYDKISKLIKNNIGLYGCHLPLDSHKEVGNNYGLLNEFLKENNIKNSKIEEFGEYRGYIIGVGARFKTKMKISLLKKFLDNKGIIFDFKDFGNVGEEFSEFF